MLIDVAEKILVKIRKEIRCEQYIASE